MSRQIRISEAAGAPYVYAGSAISSYSGTRWTFGLLSPVDLLAYSIMRWVDVLQASKKLPPTLRIALLSAVESAGSADREEVRKALVSSELASIFPGGRLSFQNGQAHAPFVVQQNEGAAQKIVYPLDWAEQPGSVRTCPH